MQEVGSKTNYFKYAECEEGQTLVDKMVYKGESQGRFGRQNNFVGGGEKTVLNSAGQLNYKLDEFVTEGDTVSVIYDGTEILESGSFKGKSVHNFKVILHDEIKNEAPKEETKAPVKEEATESLLDKINA